MEKFGERFVWIGATLRVIGATSAIIGVTNHLSPNSDGIIGLKNWLRFDFGATFGISERFL